MLTNIGGSIVAKSETWRENMRDTSQENLSLSKCYNDMSIVWVRVRIRIRTWIRNRVRIGCRILPTGVGFV